MKKSVSVLQNLSILSVLIFALSITSCQKEVANNKTVNAAAVSNNAVEQSLAKNLVAWYQFNGNTRDATSNHNDVILNAGTTKTIGKNGLDKNAYYFNGSSYMEVANSLTLNMNYITLVAVVKVQGFYMGTCHDNRIISKGYNDYSNGRYTLSFSDGLYYNYTGCNADVQQNFQNFECGFGDGQGTASGTVDSTNYIKKDKWYTVTSTYDGVFSKLYINGILRSVTQRTTTFTPNTNSLFFGRNEDPSYPYYFTGAIDEIRIYNKALTPAQVKSISNVLQ